MVRVVYDSKLQTRGSNPPTTDKVPRIPMVRFDEMAGLLYKVLIASISRPLLSPSPFQLLPFSRSLQTRQAFIHSACPVLASKQPLLLVTFQLFLHSLKRATVSAIAPAELIFAHYQVPVVHQRNRFSLGKGDFSDHPISTSNAPHKQAR